MLHEVMDLVSSIASGVKEFACVIIDVINGRYDR